MELTKTTTSIALLASLLSGFIGGTLSNTLYQANSFSPIHSSGATITSQPEIITEKIHQSAIIDVAKAASPSVVSIVVTKELTRYQNTPQHLFFFDPFGGDPFNPFQQTPNQQQSEPRSETETRQIAGGTGFIVSTTGTVITNKHVASDEDAQYTVILQNGEEYPADVVSRDPSNDLAVLQMKGASSDSPLPEDLIALPLAEDSTTQVGQLVVAIGNALGEFNNTVTTGVISAKGRSIVASDGASGEQLSDLLQTDAAINPGNSGGPLLSLAGEVVGVNTAIAQSANGIGFAIPVSEVDFVLRSIEKYGTITRPFLGVVYRLNSPELAKQFDLPRDYGALLQEDIDGKSASIVQDGPAEKAGIKGGDIILEINGEKITEKNGLKELLRKFLPEDQVTLTILRDAQEQQIVVILGKQRDETETTANNNIPEATITPGYLGVNSKEITPDLARRLQLPLDHGALLYNDYEQGIPAIAKGSPAEQAGLKAGDIIITVDQQKLSSTTTLAQAISQKHAQDTVELTILQDNKTRSIQVTLGAAKEQ